MKPSRYFIMIVIGYLLFISCFFSIESKYSSDEERIIGTWNWIKTTGGIAGIEDTPQSTGQTRTIVFDNEQIVKFYVNDSLTKEGVYRLGLAETIFHKDPEPVLFIDDSLWYAYSFPNDNKLILQENIYDGFVHEYRRK